MKIFKFSALISLALIAPFVVMELVNQGTQDFLYVLFVMLWLLAVGFIMMLRPVARQFATQTNPAVKFSVLLVGVTVLALIAGIWVGIVQDQMPCFYGVPNCD